MTNSLKSLHTHTPLSNTFDMDETHNRNVIFTLYVYFKHYRNNMHAQNIITQSHCHNEYKTDGRQMEESGTGINVYKDVSKNKRKNG